MAADPTTVARVRALQREVAHHDRLYHQLDTPEISDDAYDALYRELLALERDHPELITPESPTQKVGAAVLSGLTTASHLAPMLSLDSSNKREVFDQFDTRLRRALGIENDTEVLRYSVEPKIDGLSVELVYERGRLTRAVTRGDGLVGEDITHNLRAVPVLPTILDARAQPLPARLSVRGEVYLTLAAFDDVNERLVAAGKATFASPRNLAAGTVRQLDPALARERPLTLYVYDILHFEGGSAAATPTTHAQALTWLAGWGLPVNPENQTLHGAEAVWQHFLALEARREDLPYEIDGLVVKLDDIRERTRLGSTAHHPRWAFAIKFPPRKEISQVLRIVASVGRTGVITPVALLRPVNIGGVTVSRANLHNREDLARKDIREGDTVRVERAGDVIPQVVERVASGSDHDRQPPYRMPGSCPSCHTPVIDRGPYTVCPNAFGCPAQAVARLLHLGSRGALDIEGLGDVTAQLLVDAGLVREPADLFDVRAEQLLTLEGFAELSAQNLVAAIAAAADATLPRLLVALGVPEVGPAVALALAEHFGTLDAIREADATALMEVHGVGEVMAHAINAFFDDARNRAVIDRLLDGRVRVQPFARSEPASLALAGETIVFTGALTRFTRDAAEALVKRLGGKSAGSVSGRTTRLVVGADAGSKLAKAQTLGIPILNEAEFLDFLVTRGIDPQELMVA